MRRRAQGGIGESGVEGARYNGWAKWSEKEGAGGVR